MAAWGGAAGGVAAAMVARKRRKIVAAFREAGALSAERARTFEDLRLRSSVIFRRLVRTGILVDCGEERYYLDEETEEGSRHIRMYRVMLLLNVLALVLIAVWILAQS